MNIEEAKKLIRDGYADELLKIACDCVAPFYWYTTQNDETIKINNGTVFFINTGKKCFAVTAYHVYKGFVDSLQRDNHTKCKISNLDFDPDDRLIDYSSKLDIATFNITEKEVKRIGKIFLRGSQERWPPSPPEEGKGVFFAGYTGKETIVRPREIDFGVFRGLCVAHGVSNNNITVQFEREFSIDYFKRAPENYDLGGISGSPLITLVHNTFDTWQLGGIIYEANPSLEIISAVRANHISQDGTLLINSYP